MKTWSRWLVAILFFVSLNPTAWAQDSKGAKSDKSTADKPEASTPEPKPLRVASSYRLDFMMNELEDGKKVNSREYTVMASPDEWARLRIGTRVPYETMSGTARSVQYMDVGLNLDARLHLVGNDLALDTNGDFSSFAIPEQARGTAPNPVTRNIRSSAQVVVTLGKPTLLSSIDDPNSTKRYQLEVTVTKLK
ncbi:MAG: hypothetical protein PHX83_07205 [Acidobacteriia bacterium]|nr:hypothetical protein [Terriglobia bacterium]